MIGAGGLVTSVERMVSISLEKLDLAGFNQIELLLKALHFRD